MQADSPSGLAAAAAAQRAPDSGLSSSSSLALSHHSLSGYSALSPISQTLTVRAHSSGWIPPNTPASPGLRRVDSGLSEHEQVVRLLVDVQSLQRELDEARAQVRCGPAARRLFAGGVMVPGPLRPCSSCLSAHRCCFVSHVVVAASCFSCCCRNRACLGLDSGGRRLGDVSSALHTL